jgi:hypothetical protein
MRKHARTVSRAMPLTDEEKRRIARAIWSYAGRSQPAFAADAGLKYDRLRGLLNDQAKSPPTTDELLAMADAAGVPRALVIDGWSVADPVAQLQREVSRLKAQTEELREELRRTATEQTAALAALQARVDAAASSSVRTPGRKA